MTVTSAERKAWAKEALVGLENVTMPSFSPDFKGLDEEGIRWDVRHAIANGFFSTMCALEAGLTLDEQKRMLEIVAEEAGGRLLVSFTLLNDSFEANIELLQHGERVGASHALTGYPQSWRPRSADDIYEATARMAEASNLGLVIYASDKFGFSRFHPSQMPFDAFDRMVEIPSVVGLKPGFGDPAMVFEAFRRYSDRIQVNIGTPFMVGMFPMLRKRWNVQWFGGGAWEFWQSPEKPYLVEYFTQVMAGRIDDAMKIYWQLAPATGMAMRESIGRGGDMGMYHWPLGKYISWSVGGNGGVMRSPAMRLTGPQMQNRKMALRAIGIAPREPDEEFLVGRVAYARQRLTAAGAQEVSSGIHG